VSTLGEVLEYFNVGIVFRVSVENTVLEGVVKGKDMFPYFRGDTDSVKSDEKNFASYYRTS
jgi:hypothetical protein